MKVLVVKVSVADGLQLSALTSQLELRTAPGPGLVFHHILPRTARVPFSEGNLDLDCWCRYDVVWCGVVGSVLVTQARLLLETTKPPPALRKSHSLGEAFVGSFTGPAAAHGAKIFLFCFTTT